MIRSLVTEKAQFKTNEGNFKNRSVRKLLILHEGQIRNDNAT